MTHAVERVVVDYDLLAIEKLVAWFTELDERLTEVAQAEPCPKAESVAALRRGTDTLMSTADSGGAA